jgi:hypothetical protein
VLVQLRFEAVQIEVEPSPGRAGAGGQGEVVCERARALKIGQVVFVLGHHDLDGHEGHGAAAGEDEGKENLLFLGEVTLDRVDNLFQMLGQPARAQRF